MGCEQISARPERGWDSLIPFMQPACMGVPADLLVHNVRLAAIKFTERTGLYTQRFSVDLQKDVTEYPIDVDNCARFIALKKICYKEQTRYSPGFEPHCCTVMGNKFWYQDGQLQISFTPAYDEEEALTIEIVTALTQDSCFLPEELYQDWAETLAWGAVAKVLQTPGQPFTDYAAANLFEFKFKAGMQNCKYREERSRIRGPMKMVARRWV